MSLKGRTEEGTPARDRPALPLPMSARNLRKIKSSIHSWVSPGRKDWPYLRLLYRTLCINHARGWSQTRILWNVVDEFINCIDIFEVREKERKGYRKERGLLEEIFGKIQRCCNRKAPPEITGVVQGLCRSIERELSSVRTKNNCLHAPELLGAGVGNDEDDVLECYRRIRAYLQSITVNISAQQITDVTYTDILSRYRQLSVDASHYDSGNSGAKRGPCMRDTRAEMIGQILSSIDNSGSRSVYWINGMAGTGKTTIAYTLCQELDRSHRLAASFFCSRQLPECRDRRLVIPSIAYQLAQFSSHFRYKLMSGVLNDPTWRPQNYSPYQQFTSLISQPLREIKETLPDHPVVVIDALDECEEKEGTRQLLEVLFTGWSNDLPLKFIITSRPEAHISGLMKGRRSTVVLEVILHELDASTVRLDIKNYFLHSWQLASVLEIQEQPEEKIEALAERAGTFFAYAATIIKYICQDPFTPDVGVNRLANVLRPADESEDVYDAEIDDMYALIVGAALDDPSLDEAHKDNMRQLLYSVICAQEPLKITDIPGLRKIGNTDQVWDVLRPFWSVLRVSEDSETVCTLHPSFANYLLDPLRSNQHCCDPKVYNHPRALRCFQIFRQIKPQFNICGLDSSYALDSQATGLKGRVLRCISEDLFKAAQHWAEYLRLSAMTAELLHALGEFLSGQLLLWMEVMNLKRCTHKTPEAIQHAKEWIESGPGCPGELKVLVYDACRFTTSFALSAVSYSTPHIYVSMLRFWPSSSPIARLYARRIQGNIRIDGTAIDRRECTLWATWGFDHAPTSPVYSPCGTIIAVGVGKDIALLNSSTGRMMRPLLKGHSDMVLSVRFSPDGTHVVSGSLDKTIRVWDTKNEANVIRPIRGHTGKVNSVAFSPLGTRILSGSQDETMYEWSSRSGARLLGPLTGHGPIYEVKYSPDGRWIAACTWRGVVMRSATDGRLLGMFLPRGHNSPFRSLDISHDGERIASGSINNTVYMWDVKSGSVVLGPLESSDIAQGHAPFSSVSFSPDGSHLIASSPDRTIRIWETQPDTSEYSPLEGHTDNITSVSFSPDGAYIISGSRDKTLRQWGAQNILKRPDPLPGHANSVTSVGFSPDGARIVSGSTDGSVRVWNSENGKMLLVPLEKGHGGKIPTTYSPNGTYILSDCLDGLVLLDSQTGQVSVGPIQLDRSARSAGFSGDGTCMIVATSNAVQVLESSTAENLLDVQPPITNQSSWAHVTSAVLSPDSTRIAIGSMHSGVSIFDAHSGELLYGPLRGYNNGPSSLAFSPDSTRIASGSFSEVQVRDTKSGKVILGRLKEHTGWVHSIEYSPDGSRIVSGAKDSAICIWNSQTGKRVIGPVKWHTAPVRSVRFSPDGTHVVSGSDDKTIRVTDVGSDLQYLSDSSTPTGRDWQLNTEGWVVDDQGRLIVWVPPELRTALMWPRTKLLISRRGWLRLNFSDAHLGKSWADCYRPEPSDTESFDAESFWSAFDGTPNTVDALKIVLA